MEVVVLRVAFALALALAAAAGSAVGATAPATGPDATAQAIAVRIVYPNGHVVGSPAATSGSLSGPSYSYPTDGSIVTTGAVRASAQVTTSSRAAAAASSGAADISLFDGEITADSASAAVSAATNGSGAAGGSAHGTGVVHLQALGRPHAFGHAAVGDWGELSIAGHTSTRSGVDGTTNFTGVSIALDLKLTAAHGGLPAGAEIEVGYTEAFAETAPPAIVTSGPGVEVGDDPALLPPTTEPLIGVPQVIEPPLTGGTYDYPVYGANDYSDAYGSSNGGVSWQGGVDIFGQLGQPLVAVADGTLYQVGWNHTSGNRLWLRDTQGNEFYYSHLSAFSTLTSNDAHVRAGQVIGFMGDTGNSQGKPTHLYFEIHPVSMLFLGAAGAVDPGPYLTKWHRIASLSFPVETGWAPTVPGTIKAPDPAATLVGSSDISTASGLDPASLRRALQPRANG
jgi:murein DD-endopeptidase MepM/ murein hydrolase activator NlpD